MQCYICGAEFDENEEQIIKGLRHFCRECQIIIKDIKEDDYLNHRTMEPDAAIAAMKKYEKFIRAFDRGFERGVTPYPENFKEFKTPDYEAMKKEYTEFYDYLRSDKTKK